MEFMNSVFSNFLAIGQVLVLGSIGFLALKRGILGECCLRTVSNLVIEVTLPCFMFTNIILNFDRVRDGRWYLFPVFFVMMLVLGWLAGWLYTRVDRGIMKRREFIASVTFTNAGFLPLIIVGALLPGEIRNEVYIYIFLFTILLSPVMIGASRKIFAAGPARLPAARDVFNTAFIATVAALLISLAGAQDYVPDMLLKPLKMIGDSTIPLAMMVVGGVIMVNFSRGVEFNAGFVFKAGVLKLLAIPVIVFLVVSLTDLSREVKFLLVLEAMMPPASTLPLLARQHDGDYILMGQTLFGITIAALFTVPVLLALFDIIPG